MSTYDGNNKSSQRSSMESKSTSEKLRKAPQAPKRFKSAFIFFSTEKHREIRNRMGVKGTTEKTTNIAKMVSHEWKSMHPEEREKWEEMSRRDKIRYDAEKRTYSGPWKVSATKRLPKDPSAPKRPMSAFLSFSNNKRGQVKRQNPTVSNAEISRLLSKMWRDAPEEVRRFHIDLEYKLRQEYKVSIAEWRANIEREKAIAQFRREESALITVEAQDGQAFEGTRFPESNRSQLHDGNGASLPGPYTIYATNMHVGAGRMTYGPSQGSHQYWDQYSQFSERNNAYNTIPHTSQSPSFAYDSSQSYPCHHGGEVFNSPPLQGSMHNQSYFPGNVQFHYQQDPVIDPWTRWEGRPPMPRYDYGYTTGSRPLNEGEEYVTSSTGGYVPIHTYSRGNSPFNSGELGGIEANMPTHSNDTRPNHGYEEFGDGE